MTLLNNDLNIETNKTTTTHSNIFNNNSWAYDFSYNESNNSSTTLFNLLNQITTDSFYNFMTYATPYTTNSSIDAYSSLSASSSSLSCSHSSIVGSIWSNACNFEAKSVKKEPIISKSCKNIAPPPGFHSVDLDLHDIDERLIGKLNKNSKTKLFIGNLPSDTTLDELIKLFSKYGRVNENLSIVKQDHYAFIHFYNESDAVNALYNLNNSLFKNRYIRVQYSTSYGHIKKSKTFDLNWRNSTCIPTNKNKLSNNMDEFQFNESALGSHLKSSSNAKLNKTNNKMQMMSESKSISSFSSILKSKNHMHYF